VKSNKNIKIKKKETTQNLNNSKIKTNGWTVDRTTATTITSLISFSPRSATDWWIGSHNLVRLRSLSAICSIITYPIHPIPSSPVHSAITYPASSILGYCLACRCWCSRFGTVHCSRWYRLSSIYQRSRQGRISHWVRSLWEDHYWVWSRPTCWVCSSWEEGDWLLRNRVLDWIHPSSLLGQVHWVHSHWETPRKSWVPSHRETSCPLASPRSSTTAIISSLRLSSPRLDSILDSILDCSRLDSLPNSSNSNCITCYLLSSSCPSLFLLDFFLLDRSSTSSYPIIACWISLQTYLCPIRIIVPAIHYSTSCR